MTIKYYDQLDLTDKTVTIRVDFNVPLNQDGSISDDTRIIASLETIKHCISQKAKTVLISHLGRPKGKIVPKMSLSPVAEHLSKLLGLNVVFLDDKIESLKNKITLMKPGQVALLENIRFHPGEEKNDPVLGEELASFTDIFINDAFATSHRAHASNVAITDHVKLCAAGYLLKNEIEYFQKAVKSPVRPLCAIIGGAKVSTKIDVLRHILGLVDVVIIGGGMAFTFLKALGHEVGKSLLEPELVETAKAIMDEAESRNIKLLLPVDVIAANDFDDNAEKKVVSIDTIQPDLMGLDIGPETVKSFSKAIYEAGTVIWNGPMGAFELPNFSAGTFAIAKAIADSECVSIVGGGDSINAVRQSGFENKMSYLSTGGGAFLEMLEGKSLPAIKVLDRNF